MHCTQRFDAGHFAARIQCRPGERLEFIRFGFASNLFNQARHTGGEVGRTGGSAHRVESSIVNAETALKDFVAEVLEKLHHALQEVKNLIVLLNTALRKRPIGTNTYQLHHRRNPDYQLYHELLEASAMEHMLRERLKSQRVDELFDAMDRMAAVKEPAVMPPEEMAEEIRSMRRARRETGAV